MKLSTYIDLLEKIRVSAGADIDVFVAATDVSYGRGLMGIKEPAAPTLTPLLSESAAGDRMFIAQKAMFREEFNSSYQDAGHAVLLG